MSVMSYFSPTSVVIQAFIDNLKASYTKTFGSLNSNYGDIIQWAGTMALEIISGSDALYHNLEHTIHVTMVGQQILIGKQLTQGGITPEIWLNFIISLLCHDIGYVKGICKADNLANLEFATGLENPKTFKVAPGSTDAALTKYHVARGKLFVRERFHNNPYINAEVIAQNIELTTFPVPQDDDHADTKGFPGLVRAADLMGQISDPRYIKKIPALFYEFLETGEAKKNGWVSPDDVRKGYPSFFWKGVFPYIKEGIELLKTTQTGQVYLNNLYAGVFSQQFQSELAKL
eukprot:TRINITY_DN6677_c0_g1_i1.p1 TRINITY_DN6677_c0_g1~~TRINITY_DN6677_c0_g1_i1.p1  ORF type:complete len:289 (-),score=64.69 TRINITY_DN6677_c0_g1_i1:82-948(-)